MTTDSTQVVAPTKTADEYISEGLLKDYPDLADVPEHIRYAAIREADFPDVKDDKQLRSIMEEAYVPESVRNQKPKLSKIIGDAAWNLPGQMWASAKEQTMAPFRSAAMAAGGLGEPYFTNKFPYVLDKGGPPLNQGLSEMEDLSYQDLLKRGYSPKIAHHVMQQRIDTMQGMGEENAQAAKEGQGQAVEGQAAYISAAGTMALGAGMGAPAAIAKEAAVGLGLSETAVKGLAQKGLSAAVKHAIDGGAGIAGYNMLKAAGEGKPASEVYNAGEEGFVWGVALSPVLPIAFKVGGGVGKVVSLINDGITRYAEANQSKASQAIVKSLQSQADTFAEKFNADWLRTRFSDLATVTDPSTNLPTDLPPTTVAASLIQKVLGTDVAEHASESSVAKIAEKIRIQRMYIGKEPSQTMHIPIDPVQQMEMLSPAQQIMPGGMPEMSPREALDAAIAGAKLRDEMATGMPAKGGEPLGTNGPLGDLQPHGMPTGQSMEAGRKVSTMPTTPVGQSSTYTEPPIPTMPTGMGNPSEPGLFQSPQSENKIPFKGTFDAWGTEKQIRDTDLNRFSSDFESEPPYTPGMSGAPFGSTTVEQPPAELPPSPLDVGPVTGETQLGPASQRKLGTAAPERELSTGVDAAKLAKAKNVENEPRTAFRIRPTPNNSIPMPIKKGTELGNHVPAEVQKTGSSAAEVQKKPLPYNPPKLNMAKKGTKAWFLNTLDDLRNGWIDMPEAKMKKEDYVGKEPTTEELHNNLAHRRNKRTTAWHQTVASYAEMVADMISDESKATDLRKDAEHILNTRDSTKPTTAEEVDFGNKLLDKTIKTLKFSAVPEKGK